MAASINDVFWYTQYRVGEKDQLWGFRCCISNLNGFFSLFKNNDLPWPKDGGSHPYSLFSLHTSKVITYRHSKSEWLSRLRWAVQGRIARELILDVPLMLSDNPFRCSGIALCYCISEEKIVHPAHDAPQHFLKRNSDTRKNFQFRIII